MRAPSAAALLIAFVVAPAGLSAGTPARADEPPTVTIAGDIATADLADEATADLIGRLDPDRVLTAGDNVYEAGTLEEFEQYYAPSWGRFLDRTSPAPGNHENRTQPPDYFTYFADQLPSENDGRYYAFDLGSWRLYSLTCDLGVLCGASSAQAAWLKADLATNGAGKHKLAYLHRPRYSCGADHGPSTRPQGLWKVLLAARTDIVVAAHDHHYERFARMDATGSPSSAGIVSFVVGTGGARLGGVDTTQLGCEHSEARSTAAHGVLELALGVDAFSWRFVTVADEVLDAGTLPTLPPPPVPPPPPATEPPRFRAAASAAISDASALTLPRPADVQPDDVLIAALSLRDVVTIEPPPGWSLVRSDTKGKALHQAIYTRLAGESEPESYAWSFSGLARGAAATVLAYEGVDTVTPVDASSGRKNTPSTAIKAPPVVTSLPDTLLVGFFGMTVDATVTPPPTMTERDEVVQDAGRRRVVLEASDEAWTTVGSTGSRTATASASAPSIGQLVALRPAVDPES